MSDYRQELASLLPTKNELRLKEVHDIARRYGCSLGEAFLRMRSHDKTSRVDWVQVLPIFLDDGEERGYRQ